MQTTPKSADVAVNYEEVPYLSLPFIFTHPQTLAVAAAFAGMQAAPAHRCRVLEIGCASGGNLLPMAAVFPNSHFVGVDLGAGHIAGARALATAAGISNAEFHCQDICQFNPEGEFDYIIAHGVYSWVPAPVRDRVLELCGRHLAPSGIAFVSFMVYPGAFAYEAFRHAIHLVNQDGRPQELAGAARKVVGVLGRIAPKMAPRWGPLLAKWSKDMIDQADYSLLHDQLEENYYPVWFTDFIQHAAGHGMRHLADSSREQWQQWPELRQQVEELSADIITRNQLVDIAGFRMFRQSILSRADAPITPANPLDVIERMHLASEALISNPGGPSAATDLSLGAAKPAVPPLTPNPLDFPILRGLADRWPLTMTFAELSSHVGSAAGAPADRLLAKALLRLFETGHIEAWIDKPSYIGDGKNPLKARATKLARVQSATGVGVTNLRHKSFGGDSDKARRLVASLDGSPLSAEALSLLPSLARHSILYVGNSPT